MVLPLFFLFHQYLLVCFCLCQKTQTLTHCFHLLYFSKGTKGITSHKTSPCLSVLEKDQHLCVLMLSPQVWFMMEWIQTSSPLCFSVFLILCSSVLKSFRFVPGFSSYCNHLTQRFTRTFQLVFVCDNELNTL